MLPLNPLRSEWRKTCRHFDLETGVGRRTCTVNTKVDQRTDDFVKPSAQQSCLDSGEREIGRRINSFAVFPSSWDRRRAPPRLGHMHCAAASLVGKWQWKLCHTSLAETHTGCRGYVAPQLGLSVPHAVRGCRELAVDAAKLPLPGRDACSLLHCTGGESTFGAENTLTFDPLPR
jgi:hypothetical protein